jgi:hypothetical protein
MVEERRTAPQNGVAVTRDEAVHPIGAAIHLQGIAGADNIIADAEVYWNELHSSGAWARNKARWPSGNNVDSLDYCRQTVKTGEAWFEDYLASLD